MTNFYAQPFSIEHTGFYFNSFENFEAGMEKLNKKGCEEVEIQFINGDEHLAQLANATNIHQGAVASGSKSLTTLTEPTPSK